MFDPIMTRGYCAPKNRPYAREIGVDSNVLYRFETHLNLKISAFWTLCEKGRFRCQAVPEIFVVEVSGCGTIAGDRG